jgi:hypothetical protein
MLTNTGQWKTIVDKLDLWQDYMNMDYVQTLLAGLVCVCRSRTMNCFIVSSIQLALECCGLISCLFQFPSTTLLIEMFVVFYFVTPFF